MCSWSWMRQERAGEQGCPRWGMCLPLRARSTAHNCPAKPQSCNHTATTLLQQKVQRDLIAPVLELGNYSWSKCFGTEVVINHVVHWFSSHPYSPPSLLICLCNKIYATDLMSSWPFGYRKRCKSEPQRLNVSNCTAKKIQFGLGTNFSSLWKRKISITWDDF